MEQLLLAALGFIMIAKGSRSGSSRPSTGSGAGTTTTQNGQPAITNGTTTVTQGDLNAMGLQVDISSLTESMRAAALARKMQQDEEARLAALRRKAQAAGQDYTVGGSYEMCAGGIGYVNDAKCDGLPFWNYEDCRITGKSVEVCSAYELRFYESCRQLGFNDKTCAGFSKIQEYCNNNPSSVVCTRFNRSY
jgi:hypothetical protein